MTERSEIRTPGNLLLERLAWNAAAVAALAVMILVLLGSLEWLDRLAAPSTRSAAKSAARAEAKAEGPRTAKWP
ncbi:MAG: hypothetical protein IPK00_27410 [Deltaproteobacteria bacterium]|nr:hypothetical protein [Deltaproteobacteria bacterium]